MVQYNYLHYDFQSGTETLKKQIFNYSKTLKITLTNVESFIKFYWAQHGKLYFPMASNGNS